MWNLLFSQCFVLLKWKDTFPKPVVLRWNVLFTKHEWWTKYCQKITFYSSSAVRLMVTLKNCTHCVFILNALLDNQSLKKADFPKLPICQLRVTSLISLVFLYINNAKLFLTNLFLAVVYFSLLSIAPARIFPLFKI